MTDRHKSNKSDDKCPSCGKKIAAQSDAGSLTSYLFQPFNCSCGRSKTNNTAGTGRNFKQSSEQDAAIDFCNICGLQKIEGAAQGSLTGFLFQDTRCKCPETAEADRSDMAERFWKLRQAGAGTTFGSDAGLQQKKSDTDRITIDLLPGSTIGGNYRIGWLLGRGGMGEVYQATHMALNKECALKVIPPDQVTDNSWARFQNEAKSIAGLEHVNLVKVTDLGVHEGCLPFYAMEYINGKSVAELLQTKGPMPLPAVLDVFMQVCDGVDYAHRSGIVHRDLKPGNIMLVDGPGGQRTVKILDFGLVKLIRNDRSTQSLTSVGDVFGSPYYMSPEQCLGGKVDNRSDIYSIGCTMFECLTGRPPFTGPTAVEIVSDHQSKNPPSLDSVVGAKVFPESLELVVAKTLRKNPVERYQTLLELRSDLNKVANGESVQPYYMSRAAISSTTGGEGAASEMTGKGSAQRSDFQFLPRTVVIGTLAISTVALCSIFLMYNYFGQHASKSKPELAWTDSILATHTTKAQAVQSGQYAELANPAPFSSIVEEDGKKWRVFDFPTEVSIGRLDGTAGITHAPAQGKVKVPLDEKLQYTPSYGAMEFPECLKRFRAGDIDTLIVPYDRAATDFEGIDSCLKKLSVIPGVRDLNGSNFAGISPQITEAINDFPTITALSLTSWHNDSPALGRLNCLPRLEHLGLYGFADVSPAIEKLNGSNKLISIMLVNCGVTARDVNTIARLQSLDTCIIQGWKNSTPETVTMLVNGLSQLPQLTIVELSGNQFTLKDLKTLGSCKHITGLDLGCLSGSNEEATVTGLTALSPMKIENLEVETFCLTPKTLQALKAFPKLAWMDFNLKASHLSLREVRAIVAKCEGLTVEADSPHPGLCLIRIKR